MRQRDLKNKPKKRIAVSIQAPTKRVTRSSSELDIDVPSKPAPKKKKITCEAPEMISDTLLCRVCLVQFKNQVRYRRHLIKTHKIKSQDIILHSPELAPITKYPNTYCAFCEIDTFKADRFRQHLIGLHDLDIEVEEEYDSLIDSTIRPDPHDPDYYCLICKTASADKTDYCNHLKEEHGMKFKTGKIPFLHNSKSKDYNEDIPITDSKENTCSDCNRAYHAYTAYQRHLREVHHMDELLVSTRKSQRFLKDRIENCDFLPNPNDPNFYCRVCEMKYPKASSLITHIQRCHDLKVEHYFDYLISVPARIEYYPDYCDPHYACRQCDWLTFDTREDFHEHLRTMHQMVLPTGRCGSYSCKNVAKPQESEYAAYCMPCDDGMTVRKKLFSATPIIKPKRESLVAKHIPATDINLIEEPIKEEITPVTVQAPTVSVGKSSIFSQPPTLEKSKITLEDLLASAGGSTDTYERHMMDNQTGFDESSEDEYDLRDVKIEDFNSDSKLLRTSNERPKKDIAFCSICSVSFEQPEKYMEHLNIHCVELRDAEDGVIPKVHGYTCTTCHVKYDTKGRFIRHMNVAPHNNPAFDWMFKKDGRVEAGDEELYRIYSCQGCALEFSSKEEHHDHLKENHLDEIYRLKYLKSLVDDGTVISMDGFYIKCDICGGAFDTRSFQYHRSREHPFYPPQETDMTRYYARQKQLGIPINPHSCYDCGMNLPKNGSYDGNHMRLHYASYTRYNIVNLDDLDNFDIPPFYCGPCIKMLPNYTGYRSHVLQKHGVRSAYPTVKNHDTKIAPDIDDPRFYCRSCDFKFADRKKYRRHLKSFHKMLLPKLAKAIKPDATNE
ncbi:hypothetical protein INT47_000775 [Mucor saturninus]|uniref:C2H2-type domain-containing protein n=1 Tax=Mucor saturninus TaxID=64648 RepID=A0A8H7UTY4_9FUNG|nr:hypothetical protein INT47_000775 [Mucor saturninus]